MAQFVGKKGAARLDSCDYVGRTGGFARPGQQPPGVVETARAECGHPTLMQAFRAVHPPIIA